MPINLENFNLLKTALGLGVTDEVNPLLIAAGIIGVGVKIGVGVINGVEVIVGVLVFVGITDAVAVNVIVGEGGKYR